MFISWKHLFLTILPVFPDTARTKYHCPLRLSLDARPIILVKSTASPAIEPTLTTAAGRVDRWPRGRTRGIRCGHQRKRPRQKLACRSREGRVPGKVIPNHAGFRRIGLSNAPVEPRASAPAKFARADELGPRDQHLAAENRLLLPPAAGDNMEEMERFLAGWDEH